MAKAAKKTTKPAPIPKKKASKYHQKIVVDASFEDLMKALVTPSNTIKSKA